MLLNNYKRAEIGFIYGKKSKLFDINGKDYIDFGSGIGVNCLGHDNKILVKAIKNQAKMIIHSSNLYQIYTQEILSEILSNLAGFKTYAFFANSGAEANECAIKLARKYGNQKSPKRYEILTLKNSFHGRTIATLKATGQDKFHSDDFAPYPDGFKFFDDIDEIIENLDEKTAAVMIEPIQGEGGIKVLDKQKVQNLAKILEQKDILLICDEVQCGVFRSGEFLASKYFDISPDITTLAKGIAGGVPCGVVLSKKNIFNPGDHGSTFGGNFLATSASIAVLNQLKELKYSKKLDKKIKFFRENLEQILNDFSEIFDQLNGLGLMLGLKLKDPQNQQKIYQKSIENGLLILTCGKDNLRFLPPLNIKKSEMKLGFKRFKKVLKSLNES